MCGIRKYSFSREEAFQEEAFDLTLSAGIPGRNHLLYIEREYTDDRVGYLYSAHSGGSRTSYGNDCGEGYGSAGRRGELCLYEKTYFVGQGVSELFDTMVVSLTTDQANLYDEKTGTFC